MVLPALSGSAVFVSTTTTMNLSIENLDLVNPSVVELEFANGALSAVDFDDGSAGSPSFAMAPGSTRIAVLTRGLGSIPVMETITATLADGQTVQTTVYVQTLDPLKTVLLNISAPTFQFTMDAVDASGRMINTGSLAAHNADMFNCTTTVDAVDGYDGYVDVDGTTDYTSAYFGGYPLASDILRTEDRSYLMVFDITADIASNRYLTLCTALSSNNAWGWLYGNSSIPGQLKTQYLLGSTQDLSAANGTNDNPAGSPADLATTGVGGTPRRTILAVTYEHAGGATVIRWKQTGNGPGHTYIAGTSAAENSAGAAIPRWMGWSTGAVSTVNWRYMAVVNTVLSSVDFDGLAESAIL